MALFPQLITSVSSLIKIADEARLICGLGGLLLQASNAEHRVAAVLELPRISFGLFPVFPQTYVDGVKLSDLQMTLAPSYGDHTMCFIFDLPQRILRFTFLGPNSSVRNCEISFIDPPIFANYAEVMYSYDVYVGISPQTFQFIMSYLHGITAHNKVVVTVTRTDVRFASGDVAIILQTESGDCIIGGMEGINGIAQLEICKFSINALLEASRLCVMVWLLKALYNPAPDLVCCPVGLIGYLKFHYIPSFPVPVGPSHPPPNPRMNPPDLGMKRRKLQHG